MLVSCSAFVTTSLSAAFILLLSSPAALPLESRKKSRVNKFTIVFQECEEGGFTAYIKEFPGAISEGETAVEAGLNAFDALVQLLAAQAEEQLKNLDVTPHEVELAFA